MWSLQAIHARSVLFHTHCLAWHPRRAMWRDAPLKALFPSSRYASFVALLQSLGSGPLKKLSLRSSSVSVGKAARPGAHRPHRLLAAYHSQYLLRQVDLFPPMLWATGCIAMTLCLHISSKPCAVTLVCCC